MRRWTFVKLTMALVAVAIAGFLSACSHGEASANSNAAPASTVESVPDLNVISVENPERFSVVAAVARREADQLTATGVVAADVSRTVPVNVLSSGRVTEIRARLGDDVQKEQVLLRLTSPDMSQAISDYQKFRSGEALAKTQLDRAKLLYDRGALAQKDLEVAEDAYAKAKVDTQTAAERIRILGGDLEHPSSSIEVRAPVAGTIIEQNVTAAAGVKSLDNSPNLFTIADLSSVWVLTDVFENNLAQVHLGDRADIELNAYPNRRFNGRVTNIAKLLDPNTRTAKVRIELSNAEGLFRPNMFATVHFISQGSAARLVVPAGAVLRLQDRDWVFVKQAGNKFRRTEVHAGASESDGTVQILSGLRAGDQVVTTALVFDREAQK